MKRKKHLEWLTAILLFFTFIFNTSLTNARLDNSFKTHMDNTIYQYKDGNGNRYFFYISPAGNCIMEYEPVKPAESSNGHYNGGDMFITAITMADYNYLVQLLKVAVSDKVRVDKPEKGCGSVVVITGKHKEYPVDCDSGPGRTVEGLVAGYRKKYTVTTGKADPAEQAWLVGGTIKEEFYESKKGIRTDIKEYYFIPVEEELAGRKLEREYFIKLWEGKVLKEEVSKYAGKKVLIKAFFKRGLWDATDEQHASRLGDYVAILEIKAQ